MIGYILKALVLLVLAWILIKERRNILVSILETKANTTWIVALLSYVFILLHYVFVGYSVKAENNLILLFGLFILVLNLILFNWHHTQNIVKATGTVLKYFSIIFVLFNLMLIFVFPDRTIQGDNYFGPTENPNMIGAYLSLICYAPILGTLLVSKGSYSRIFSIILWLSCVYLILMTRSRASILVVMVITLYMIWKNVSGTLFRKIAYLIPVLILGGLALVLASQKYGDIPILSTREALYVLRLNAISLRPWLGWGFNAEVFTYFDQNSIYPAMEKGNTTLQFMEEFGIPIGVGLIFILYYQIFSSAARYSSYDGGLVLGGILLGCGIHLQFETWLLNFPSIFANVFWLLLLTPVRNSVSGETNE